MIRKGPLNEVYPTPAPGYVCSPRTFHFSRCLNSGLGAHAQALFINALWDIDLGYSAHLRGKGCFLIDLIALFVLPTII